MWWQIVAAVMAAGAAFVAKNQFGNDVGRITYVIGDLHGDVDCAKFWVEKIGLVDSIEKPTKWKNRDATLVFMGDYIDKGPFSYQTMMFVKSLTDAFPEQVTAIMGNHEMEILKDRHPGRQPKYLHSMFAVVHPEEYANFVTQHRPLDDTDDYVIDLLMNITLEVYAHGAEQQILFAPESQGTSRAIVDLVPDESLKKVLKDRLTEYQKVYLESFMSDTTLGSWLESLKVAHVENGVLFVHGGINEEITNVLVQHGSIDNLNELVRQNARNEQFLEFLYRTKTGTAIEEMLFYRGNHKATSSSCLALSRMLGQLDDVHTLAVGHTPDENIRNLCGGQFLALDSLLGRWIRTSGNYYCPQHKRVSSNGRMVCPDLEMQCQGQIVKIDSNKRVTVIHP